MKGNEHLDITQPKYNGSSDLGYHPVLCINNVKEEDEDVYKIKVRNGIGDDVCCAEELIIQKGTERFTSYHMISSFCNHDIRNWNLHDLKPDLYEMDFQVF